MFIKVLLCLLFCSAAFVTAFYENYRLYDVDARNEFEKEILLRMSEQVEYDFFVLPRTVGVAARIMVQPEDQAEFEATLEKFGLIYNLVNTNVGKSVRFERMQNTFLRSVLPNSSRITFTRFYRFSEINAYLNELANSYPRRVTVNTIGRSHEGRNLNTITITNGDGNANKKVILVDAGIHAREWIAPAEALYIIHQLAENYAANANLLKDYDWVILPVVNPDGYEYTHTHERFWRKTRKPVVNSCVGTDANRNFDFHWGELGASTNPCADTYRGPTAFSEPETKELRDLMHKYTGRAKMYLTLHSYGSYLLYPWGYTPALPSTWRDLDEIAVSGAAAIYSATGRRYTVGSSTNILYAASGGSDDYAFGKAGIPVSITMELPAGGSGFDPSPSQIKPFVEETWIGVKTMAEHVMAKY